MTNRWFQFESHKPHHHVILLSQSTSSNLVIHKHGAIVNNITGNESYETVSTTFADASFTFLTMLAAPSLSWLKSPNEDWDPDEDCCDEEDWSSRSSKYRCKAAALCDGPKPTHHTMNHGWLLINYQILTNHVFCTKCLTNKSRSQMAPFFHIQCFDLISNYQILTNHVFCTMCLTNKSRSQMAPFFHIQCFDLISKVWIELSITCQIWRNTVYHFGTNVDYADINDAFTSSTTS